MYGALKAESTIESIIDKVQKDCKMSPLVMVVGTSLAKEVVDTSTIIKDFKRANSQIVYINPEAPYAANKKLIDKWVPIKAKEAAALLGFRRKQQLVKVKPITIPAAEKRRGVKKLFPVITVFKDPSPEPTVKQLETKARRRKYYLKEKEKKTAIRDRLSVLPSLISNKKSG